MQARSSFSFTGLVMKAFAPCRMPHTRSVSIDLVVIITTGTFDVTGSRLNVRGNLVPVIDFGRFIFDERTLQTERSRLLLVRQHGGTVGLLVDEVFGQRTVDDQQRRESVAEDDPRLTRFVQENVGIDERAFAVFSMSRLVRAPDFRQAAV